MDKSVEGYLNKLNGWQREAIEQLRGAIMAASPALTEAFKWAQPVYEANGPVCYVKAHARHVTFGFWRGAELMPLYDGLQTSGSRMAHVKFYGVAEIDARLVAKLVREGVALNKKKGNPAKRR